METDNELKTEREIKDYRAQAAAGVWGDESTPDELSPEHHEDEPSRDEPEQDPAPRTEVADDRQPEPDDTDGESAEAGDEPTLNKVLTSIQDLAYRVQQAEKRVGSVQNAIQNPQARKDEGESPTPTKDEIQAAVFDSEKWDEMVDTYPELEEPLNLIKDTLIGVVDKTGPSIDEKIGAITKTIDGRLADHAQSVELKFVTRAHPDWKEVKDSKEFKEWVLSKPLEFQDTARTTGDALEVIRILDTFKAENPADESSTPDNLDPSRIVQKRQERLQRSGTPRTRGKPTKSKAVEDMTDEEYRRYIASRYDKL